MIYIRNCSNRVIHLADVMILPDQKVKDVNPHTGAPYSEIPVIKKFMEMGMLELVDVRPATKKEDFKPIIKVEIEEVSEEDEPAKATEKPADEVVEEEEKPEAEEPAPETPVEKKTTQNRGRKKKS